MRCKASTIEKLHGFLKGDLSTCIVGDTSIRQPNSHHAQAWSKRHVGGRIEFALLSDPIGGQVYSHSGRPIHELRNVGDANTSGWVSWREVWDKTANDDNFLLLDAAFTFFWGARTQHDQLFRAEWATATATTHLAGHPHWHCDVTDEAGLSVSQIHFGMAGWTGGGSAAACWQSWPTDENSVRAWAYRTLEYCREQLEHYPPRRHT